jgi:3-hydroxybutyryl-CoA dehydratase
MAQPAISVLSYRYVESGRVRHGRCRVPAGGSFTGPFQETTPDSRSSVRFGDRRGGDILALAQGGIRGAPERQRGTPPPRERQVFFEQLEVGMEVSTERTVSHADISAFAEVSGDHNPVHLDQEFAEKRTPFKGVIAHGMLAGSFISSALGNELPGHGAIYMAQSMRFCAPVRPGDTVTTKVKVRELIPEKNRVMMDTSCAVGEVVVLEGSATLMVPSRA